MIQIQTRIKFTRLGYPGMNKPQDIILSGNASDENIVGAITEEGRKRYVSSNIRLVKGAGGVMTLAFYVDGGKLGEGTITREWP